MIFYKNNNINNTTRMKTFDLSPFIAKIRRYNHKDGQLIHTTKNKPLESLKIDFFFFRKIFFEKLVFAPFTLAFPDIPHPCLFFACFRLPFDTQ